MKRSMLLVLLILMGSSLYGAQSEQLVRVIDQLTERVLKNTNLLERIKITLQDHVSRIRQLEGNVANLLHKVGAI